MAGETVHLSQYEEVQFFFRKHWVHFLKIIGGGLFIGLLVFIVLLGLYGFVTVFYIPFFRFLFVFIAVIGVFVYFNLFFLEIISYYFDLVIVTDTRIIVVRKTVFLKNDSGAIDLTKIQDLSVEARGLLRNYLRYGKMIITLSASVPPICLECVPRPHDYLERANRVKREHIFKRQERRLGPEKQKSPEDKTDAYLQDIRHLLDERVVDSP